jgi:uncharacterized membrane protein YidH (DUF202 family)
MTIQNKVHKDFRRVFYRREGNELLGKGFKNMWILIAILFITFTAIGFASGSLKYLKKKMDDPFINWVNVNIPYGKGSEGQEVMKRLNEDTIAQKTYHFANVTAYYRYPLAFYNQRLNGTVEIMGRTININDPILEEIFKKKNLVKGRPFKDAEDMGIIVTQEFLEKFGYEQNEPFIQMSLALGDQQYETIPVPVIAVLHELPGMTLFATTPYFRQLKKEPAKSNPFRRDATKELTYYVAGDTAFATEVKLKMKQYFEKEYASYRPWVNMMASDQSFIKGFIINISFIGDLNLELLDEMAEKLKENVMIENADEKIWRVYTFKTYPVYEYSNFDFLAINFTDLSQVRSFKDYFFKTYNLRIDIAQIEAKENYNYVTKITLIISFILIIFSVLVISMFVSNLLSRHLDKIRPNIGTFKAFGLSNNALLEIYLTLTFWFIVSAMSLAYLFSAIFGGLGGIRLGLALVNATIESGETYFDIVNVWLLTAVLMVLFSSITVVYLVANRILRKTPGDLIYNRQ